MSDIPPPVPDASWPPPPIPVAVPKNSFFLGRFGLRAGWGIAIFIVVTVIFMFIGGLFGLAATGHAKEFIHAQNYAKAHPGTPKPVLPFLPALPIVNDGISFAGMLLMCWLFSRGERRPLAFYGIGKPRRADVIPGALWGLVIMSALIALLHSLHLLVFDSRALYGFPIVVWGLKWLLAFALVGFAEEYTFRGYVQYTLMRGLWGLAERVSTKNPAAVAFWLAAILLSCGFGAAHLLNQGETFFGISQVICIGLVFCYALWRTGSLWWAIGFHATWDWAQSFLFGVADSGNISVGRLYITHPTGKPLLSGGTDGPEGSVYVFAAVIVTFLVIHFTTRPGLHPGPYPTEAGVPPEPIPVIA